MNAYQTQQCSAIKKNGERCSIRRVFADDGLCFYHSPLTADERAKGRQAGGAGTSSASRALKLMPARLRPIFERLEHVFEQLDAGEYDRQQATAMASVASVLVKIVQVGEIEERTRELERIVHEQQATWRSAG